jgi:hypothetical protein
MVEMVRDSGDSTVIGAPIFVNVYWNSGWNAAMASFPLCTMASLDAFTREVIVGSYFDRLGQYGVFNSAAMFAGSVQVGPTPPAELGGIEIEAFVEGFLLHPPPGTPSTPRPQSTIYNIFLPPGTDFVRTPGNPDSTVGGYHWLSLVGGIAYTVIVTKNSPGATTPHAGILGSFEPRLAMFKGLTAKLTHEMVEAATDPDGHGWRDRSLPLQAPLDGSGLRLPVDLNGEVADIGGNPRSIFLAGNTADYWSNLDGGNTPGHAFSGVPLIRSIVPTAQQGISLTIHGSGFGPPPPDLALPGMGKTAFFVLQDSAPEAPIPLLAGHPLGAASLNFVGWQDHEIRIEGCDDSRLSAAHALSIQVFGRNNGQESAVFVRAAAIPSSLRLERTPLAEVASFTPFLVRGCVLDQFNNPFLPGLLTELKIKWSLPGLGLVGLMASIDASGRFGFEFVPSHSGSFELTVRIEGFPDTRSTYPFRILPFVEKVIPDHRPLRNDVPVDVVLTGIGLGEVNMVWFGAQGADTISVSQEGTHLLVKAPDTGGGNEIGWVDVVASVLNGDGTRVADSEAGPNTLFAFYKPGIPIMRPALDNGFEVSPAQLTAVVWDDHGLPFADSALATQIRFRTDRGSFEPNATAREFTPQTLEGLEGNEVFAQLFENSTGFGRYTVSVGLVDQDAFRSSRSVLFNLGLHELTRKLGKLRGRISINGIRDLLKEWVIPPIPKDRFTALARPLQVEIASVRKARRPATKMSMTHEVSVQVKDAAGNPVVGLPVAFLGSGAILSKKVPVLTGKLGLAKTSLRLPAGGSARVHAVIDEHPQSLHILVGQLTKRLPLKTRK